MTVIVAVPDAPPVTVSEESSAAITTKATFRADEAASIIVIVWPSGSEKRPDVEICCESPLPTSVMSSKAVSTVGGWLANFLI